MVLLWVALHNSNTRTFRGAFPQQTLTKRQMGFLDNTSVIYNGDVIEGQGHNGKNLQDNHGEELIVDIKATCISSPIMRRGLQS